MGNSCAKGPPREADEDGAGTEKAGFRDRRLSVSQVPSEKGSPNRRLSVYNEDTEPPAEVLAEISSVAVKSVAGMEPVPGGATRKINQVRACSSLSFLRSPTGNPIHRSCSGSRAHRVPVHGRHDARSHGLL
jgi:hypothetical protein